MGKNAKYCIDYAKPNPVYPSFRPKIDPKIVKSVVTIDDQTVPSAEFYADTNWIMPGFDGDLKLAEPHTHKFGEMLGFYGFNYDNIQDLGAEIAIVIDGENNVLERSFAAYVPP